MKYASLIFDFDSTIVDCETLDMMSEVALAGRRDRDAVVAEVRRLTVLGMEGAIPFGESLARRISLIAPTRDVVREVAARMVKHITPSFLAHKRFFTEHRDRIYVISGGFEEIIFPVADALGIDRSHVLANAFVYDAGGVASVDHGRSSAHAAGKARAVEEAGVLQPRVIIGDGWTDYEIRKRGAADAFIAYIEHVKRAKVVAKADAVAASFDDLLQLL
ncbi:HAD-IB family phosphatase [Candidatus Kaiserbacteria bacterium]|nr:HAD-IB family phosphatase [Candidatus Kaiserbacteria bacterium]